VNPPPQPCLHATINAATYPISSTFYGDITNNCGESISGTLKFTASMLCMGQTRAEPAHYASITLSNHQILAWSYNEEALCYTCTNHKIVAAPPFYIKGTIFASGVADPDGWLGVSNTATKTTNNSNAGMLGQTC